MVDTLLGKNIGFIEKKRLVKKMIRDFRLYYMKPPIDTTIGLKIKTISTKNAKG